MNTKIIKAILSIILVIIFSVCPALVIGTAAADTGDIDLDEKITSADALAALQYATGTLTLTSEQKKVADVNKDGEINSADALEILQYITTGKSLYIKKDDNNSPSKPTGTFTVTCYGYGHGVGMSQYGAIYFADSGWKYDKILLHYYYSDKTKIVKDNSIPSDVTYDGVSIPVRQYIAGTVFAEIGDYCNIEAIKAQTVAAYTFAKYYNFNVKSSHHAYKEFEYSGTVIEKAMDAVWGEYLSYDGEPILALYCSSIGGKNTNIKYVWQGADIPYLRGGRYTIEPDSINKRVYTFTADEIKTMVKNNLGVTLTGDPSTWFTDIVHDKSVSDDIGHIISLKVGGATVKGIYVMLTLFKGRIRSHCIGIKYNP